MTIQTREQDFVTVQGSFDKSTVQITNDAQISCEPIPVQRDETLSSSSFRKALVGFVRRLAVVYCLLVAPPATEQERIRNAMVKAKHDRYISFLR